MMTMEGMSQNQINIISMYDITLLSQNNVTMLLDIQFIIDYKKS